jgi:hypothetical protein
MIKFFIVPSLTLLLLEICHSITILCIIQRGSGKPLGIYTS